MNILVAYASRMGSTAEIAEHISQQLRAAGHAVVTSPCATAPAADSFGAIVIGSALYFGRWDQTATRYLRNQAAALIGRPTWLFQSGPAGKGAEAEQVGTPRAVRRLIAQIGLAPPMTFGGRLERNRATSRISRWMATGTFAGDFRDWPRISAWTTDVLADLASGAAVVVAPLDGEQP